MTNKTNISSDQPDWSREKPIPGRYEPWKKLLGSIRRYQELQKTGGFTARVLKPWTVLRHRFWSIVCGSDVPVNCRLGGGLMMPHPIGIVIHPEAETGPNCIIFQQVTIGTGPIPGVPVIRGHVDIGAGARILGGVTIGEHAKIGANAVVIRDIPSNSTAVGIPAKILSNGKAD
jgi:serine O-acetyltransferase